jgi:two-component system, NtrC family, sensor histidine kinase KinB
VQGEAGDRRRFGGIGLGLYIVRQLAEAQDGEIAAEGREGGGTVMRLRLRRADAPGGPPAAGAPAAPAAKQPAGG